MFKKFGFKILKTLKIIAVAAQSIVTLWQSDTSEGSVDFKFQDGALA